VERLKECLAVAKTVLGTMDGEADDARATDMVTYTKLVGELIFFVSIVELFHVLTLNLCISQRYKSS